MNQQDFVAAIDSKSEASVLGYMEMEKKEKGWDLHCKFCFTWVDLGVQQ